LSSSFSVWTTALLTLGVYSFLIGYNPVFAIVEHLFVGIGAGYMAAIGLQNIVKQGFTPLTNGNAWLVVPIALGIMIYARYSRPVAWLSRYPIAIVVAVGSALTISGTIQAQFIAQIQDTIVPLTSFSNIVLVVGTATTIWYFYFGTLKSKAAQQSYEWISVAARATMMMAFGAGYTGILAGNIARMVGIIRQLFGEWLHFIK